MGVVLVVGGAGFIGSHLVAALLRQGHTVRVLDNFSAGSIENLRAAAGAQRMEPRELGRTGRLDVIFGDVRDGIGVAKAVRGVELIFHHAALVPGPHSFHASDEMVSVDVNGILNVLSTAKREGVRRVIYASSWEVYGNGRTLPLREDLIPQPGSGLAASKVAGEGYCRAFWEMHGLETVCLRYFSVYGPGQQGAGHVGALMRQLVAAVQDGAVPTIYGDGEQTRDFVFIEDAVRATVAAAVVPGLGGCRVNVATGQMTSVRELLAVLGKVVGRTIAPRFAPERPGEIRQSLGDTTLARTLLGVAAEVSLNEGLMRTLEGYPGRARQADAEAVLGDRRAERA